MVVLVTCKNEEDPIKSEGDRVFTKVYIGVSDANGQINVTPKSVLGSRQDSNSSERLS